MITQITLDEDHRLTIAYSGSTAVLGFEEAEGMLVVNMPSSAAMHLMLELREALSDLHSEPGETDE